ncbi:magnesium/cobalt transporter CorA [Oscillatoria amoena NRMC-F 0135]|nr:magnesium/cobalt transporter CorA [Oscillatoria amoena NRMC-F 0135]
MKKRRPAKSAKPSNKVILELIAYNKTQYEKFDNLKVDHLLQKLNPDRVNWINLDGLEDKTIIKTIQEHFNLHALLIDDVLDDQRPKAEDYDDYLFFTLKMLYSIKQGTIEYEQISFVLGNNYLISFQEKEGDLFDSFRDRIRLDQGRVRKRGADYLLYRLIDIIIDNYYIVLDSIGEKIEIIEDSFEHQSTENTFQRIQRLKKELIYLRKAVYPLRDALSKVMKGESGFISDENTRYFSDIYDHVIHLTDSIDTYKDLTSSLMDIHINTQNNQLNKVIKVLTIISTIFIPLTFIVGVYGMNFDNMPELRWHFGYGLIWIIMITLAIGMLGYFKAKKWF